jgi:YesN/AraC family two-component response regulator
MLSSLCFIIDPIRKKILRVITIITNAASFCLHAEELEISQERYGKKLLVFIQLISSMHDIHKEKHQQVAVPTLNRPHRYSETIMQWVEKHYTEDFDLGKLAEEMHLSKFYVSRIFRQETGSNITDYLTARRIKQACRLLETTPHSIEQIGAQVGLHNPSYFCQLFKKITGKPPLQYRINM